MEIGTGDKDLVGKERFLLTNMMRRDATLENEIIHAAHRLNVDGSRFQRLSLQKSAELEQLVSFNFLSIEQAPWWSRLREPKIVRKVASPRTDELLFCIVPSVDELVYVAAEDFTYTEFPFFETTPAVWQNIMKLCHYEFEYYVFSKNVKWIVCRDHEDYIHAAGEPVISRLRDISL